jgi:hypothetical protein
MVSISARSLGAVCSGSESGVIKNGKKLKVVATQKKSTSAIHNEIDFLS